MSRLNDTDPDVRRGLREMVKLNPFTGPSEIVAGGHALEAIRPTDHNMRTRITLRSWSSRLELDANGRAAIWQSPWFYDGVQQVVGTVATLNHPNRVDLQQQAEYERVLAYGMRFTPDINLVTLQGEIACGHIIPPVGSDLTIADTYEEVEQLDGSVKMSIHKGAQISGKFQKVVRNYKSHVKAADDVWRAVHTQLHLHPEDFYESETAGSEEIQYINNVGVQLTQGEFRDLAVNSVMTFRNGPAEADVGVLDFVYVVEEFFHQNTYPGVPNIHALVAVNASPQAQVMAQNVAMAVGMAQSGTKFLDRSVSAIVKEANKFTQGTPIAGLPEVLGDVARAIGSTAPTVVGNATMFGNFIRGAGPFGTVPGSSDIIRGAFHKMLSLF